METKGCGSYFAFYINILFGGEFWKSLFPLCKMQCTLKFMPAHSDLSGNVIKQTDFHHLMIIFTQGVGVVCSSTPTYPLCFCLLKGNICMYQCVIKVHAPSLVLMQNDIMEKFRYAGEIIILLKYLHNVVSIIFFGDV